MAKLLSLFSYSIGKKLIMALTGLFLCLFLVGHLAGNLLLFVVGDAGKQQFNEYALFMTTNPFIRVLSILTFISILGHSVKALLLTMENRKARPVRYVKEKASANSVWSSRNMGVLGSLILVFIILHLSNFWYQMKFGEIPMVNGIKDLHGVVIASFQQPWYVAIYVLAQFSIAFHLWHGFQSGFQSLGLNHKKYSPLIYGIGAGFSILVPLGFAAIPVFVYLMY